MFVLPLQLAWKLSGNTSSMELKKKVTEEIAAENNMSVDFSELIEETEEDNINAPNCQELDDQMPCQDNTDESSESDDGHPHSHKTNTSGLESDENMHGISNSDGSDDEVVGQRNRRWWHLGCA